MAFAPYTVKARYTKWRGPAVSTANAGLLRNRAGDFPTFYPPQAIEFSLYRYSILYISIIY